MGRSREFRGGVPKGPSAGVQDRSSLSIVQFDERSLGGQGPRMVSVDVVSGYEQTDNFGSDRFRSRDGWL